MIVFFWNGSPYWSLAVLAVGPLLTAFSRFIFTRLTPREDRPAPAPAATAPPRAPGWSGRVREWTRFLHEELRATAAPFRTPQSPPPTPRRATAPAELRAVHRLPIAEWHSEQEMRHWSVAKLKREAERTGVHASELHMIVEKKDLYDLIVKSWGGSSGSSCCVCLLEYEPGDTLRVLPCTHRFHVECIDRWLLSQSCTCPLCNTAVGLPTT